jgi:hypothetical protein
MNGRRILFAVRHIQQKNKERVKVIPDRMGAIEPAPAMLKAAICCGKTGVCIVVVVIVLLFVLFVLPASVYINTIATTNSRMLIIAYKYGNAR